MSDTTRFKNRQTVAVDLDATLATYHGWQGLEAIGDPRPGAQAFVAGLLETHDVVIHTARVSDRDGREPAYAGMLVIQWLGRHGFPLHGVNVWGGIGKPMAQFYVDDRGVTIRENPGPDDYNEVLAFIRSR